MLRLSTSNTALIQKMWDTKLRMDTQKFDIFTALEGTYAEKTKQLPNSCFVKVNHPASKGVRQHTIGFLKDLVDNPIEGRDTVLGNEEDQVLKQITLYANEVKTAVNTERYGVDAIDKAGYNLLSYVNTQMAKKHGEYLGKYYREALCENLGSMLVKAPSSLTKGINPNVFVAGVTIASQPAYSATLATYKTNIDTACVSPPLAANQASISVLNNLIQWITVTKMIKPITINGKNTYIVTIPSAQAAIFRTPNTTNSLSGLWKDADVRGPENQALTTYLGSYGCLTLIEDPRSPMMTTNDSGTISFGYVNAGGTDGRAAAGLLNWECGFVLGEGAVAKFEVEPLHYEDEVQDYGRTVGVGAFATYGTQAMVFDIDTATDTSNINKSSALVLFGSKI